MKEMTFEEKVERVKNFRPIDDAFFEVLAANKEVCEEILRTILEDSNLVVSEVITQKSEKNIYGRSVRLDALCVLGDGTQCNVEVQRSDNDDHLKRARYNASVITARESNTGERFDEILELYIIYISEFDFLKGKKTIYHLDKVLRETGKTVDDGLHEIFVNTAIDDNSDIAELMSCFTKKEVNNDKFPAFSKEVKRLKTTEGGVSTMCDVMEKYIQEGRDEGREDEILSSVADGDYSIKRGAEKLKITVEQFLEKMAQKGLTAPTE